MKILAFICGIFQIIGLIVIIFTFVGDDIPWSFLTRILVIIAGIAAVIRLFLPNTGNVIFKALAGLMGIGLIIIAFVG